ncbi:exodeoxyribonuclease VII small subunit [Salinicola aestuarinus]|uniref:exodeoxyribonuclease VII small subunit n=1 Tax=Salinicola aestuarinus TaxID=1949082 RepID=UPI000DA24245|nr:exodeoxyribonuclease VII small subunit [Salinicola aestuarinus]
MSDNSADRPATQADRDPPQDFAATLSQLEGLVSRLESGELSLEASLEAFERGIRLTRDAQRRLDGAELKVQALLEQADGGLEEVAFDAPQPDRGAGNGQ